MVNVWGEVYGWWIAGVLYARLIFILYSSYIRPIFILYNSFESSSKYSA